MLPQTLQAQLQEMSEKMPLSRLKDAAAALSQRYRGERKPGQRLLTEDVEALAYALVRMPATFGAVSATLAWSLECTEARPTSLLDVGSGTGAAVWACDSLLSLDQVTCLEREGAMSRLGSTLMRGGDGALPSARWLQGDLTGTGALGSAQLVTSAYVLNELSPADRARAVEKLWQATEQLLLIVEPGTPEAWRMMLEIRRQLLSLGAHLAAPCPGTGDCPIGRDDWCCFTVRVQRSRIHRLLKGGDVPYEDEKFTYLAFTREASRPAGARVLRHPQIGKGRIGLSLCTEGGAVSRTVTKQDGDAFRLARKLSAGDAFPMTNEAKDGRSV